MGTFYDENHNPCWQDDTWDISPPKETPGVFARNKELKDEVAALKDKLIIAQEKNIRLGEENLKFAMTVARQVCEISGLHKQIDQLSIL